MPNRTPPRYVPTLTEVIKSSAAPVPAPAPAGAVAGLSQEQLIHRVMQRVDLTLERRLREAVAAVVLEQTRTLGPLLRDEIESVVRETVAQAFADEASAAGRRLQK
jgi:hypothetical protein